MKHELDILSLCNSGVSSRDIKRKLKGVKSWMITHVKRKHGLKLDPRGRKPGQTKRVKHIQAQARKMKSDGYTYKEIGDKFGFSRQRANQLLSTDFLKQSDKCENCGRGGVKLNWHHLNYISDRKKLLCVACHHREHAKQNGGFFKNRNLFQSSITINKKKIHLGTFKTQREARAVYLNAVYKLESSFPSTTDT